MSTPFPDSFHGAAALTRLGAIRALGDDAAAFLHGQLTSDVTQLGLKTARLAAYCSPKGRVLASFVLWKNAPDDILLVCSADLLAPTLKRLSMFVMRAKCKLSDVSADLHLHGVAGEPAGQVAAAHGLANPWDKAEADAVTWVRLPDAAGQPRLLRASTIPAANLPWPALDESLWLQGEVLGAVARIEAGTVDQFVPQMLNYELVGGVDFKKGCYPGQEVVARSQYRGTTKRRSLLFRAAGTSAAPGQEIFHSADPGQPAGMVVNAAGRHVLAEVKLVALEGGTLHLGSAEGSVLESLEMPYPVPLKADTDNV